jgi:hypothetical protein
LKFCFGHLLILMAAAANDFKEKTERGGPSATGINTSLKSIE